VGGRRLSLSAVGAAVLVVASLHMTSAAGRATAQVGSQQSTQEGLALLHKMQDALGGAKALAAIRDLDETIVGEARDSTGASLGEVRKRTRWMQHPSALRLDQRGPRGTYVLYLDGQSMTGWEILPDVTSPDHYKTTGTAVALAGGELDFAKGYLTGFELTLWLADVRGYTVTTPRANVVRISHDGNSTEFTLDPATGLPAKSAGVSIANPNQPVSAEMRFEAWKDFAGVRFPTKRANYHDGVNRGEVTTESLRTNAGLKPAELAAKPADFMPVMK